jgi:hypothetical protein
VSFIARIARIAFSRVRSARISRRIALSRLASLASRRSPRRRRCDRRRLFGAGFWYRAWGAEKIVGAIADLRLPHPFLLAATRAASRRPRPAKRRRSSVSRSRRTSPCASSSSPAAPSAPRSGSRRSRRASSASPGLSSARG